ncbi:uncharacterized protein IUM83_08072 [Phytophthora cinnamomi]|uniref:uncharacterized protein n=1 Tax=Phytophthora cinnamomi TaxID=4785 RepID=UPI00355A4F32|nr:hypothetical protein IUM83_08072 [Phytophthora cinnamomi]
MEELTSSERAGDDQYTEQHTEQVQNEKKILLYIKDLSGSSFKYKQLRFFCKKLGVHGYKNKTKAAMVDLIIQRKINETSYDALFEKKKKARSDPPLKQKQCPFRLLNVLFSDEFELATTGGDYAGVSGLGIGREDGCGAFDNFDGATEKGRVVEVAIHGETFWVPLVRCTL